MHQFEDVPSSERTGAPEEGRLYSFRVPAVMLLRFRTTDSQQTINERVGLFVVRRFTTRILQQKKSTRNIRAVVVQDLDQRRMDESFHNKSQVTTRLSMTASKNSSSFAKQAKITKKKSIKNRIRRRPNRYTKHLRTKNRVDPRHYTLCTVFFPHKNSRINNRTKVQASRFQQNQRKKYSYDCNKTLQKSKHEHTGAALTQISSKERDCAQQQYLHKMSFFTHDLFPFLSRINQDCTMMMMMMIASTAATKKKQEIRHLDQSPLTIPIR